MAEILLVFDVDGTLSPSTRPVLPELRERIRRLRNITGVRTAIISGSDARKVLKQFGIDEMEDLFTGSNNVLSPQLDYAFFENGLMAYKAGQKGNVETMHEGNFLHHVGEEGYMRLVNRILELFASLEIPKKRGNFIELRTANLNISPIGRSCTIAEREEFAKYEREVRDVRTPIRSQLDREFAEAMKLEFVVGGQISIDISPKGWNKAFIFNLINAEDFAEIHFFGDRCHPGGNDYPLFIDPRVTHPHSITSPSETALALDEVTTKLLGRSA